MPIQTSEITTKAGHRVLRSDYVEPVTVPDAEGFMRLVAVGGPHEHSGHLVVGKLTALTGEVRRVLESQQANPTNPPPVAFVISSAVLRMVASLAMRGGGNQNGEFFPNEAAASVWLDGRMAVYAQRRDKRP